ncbi:MAG: hypothetical protein PHP66_08715, partial [Syntrophales bacterium]|nr:hypothetical protein [Syntrophales bacterium]
YPPPSMVGKYQTTLAGSERLQVVNVRLSLPSSSGQFWIITPKRCLKFGMTRVNHLIPPFLMPLLSDPLARYYSYRRLSCFAFLWSKSISDLDTP